MQVPERLAGASSLDELVGEAIGLVDTALRATLLVSGYQVRRGEIRKHASAGGDIRSPGPAGD